jgi:hypothetical protein
MKSSGEGVLTRPSCNSHVQERSSQCQVGQVCEEGSTGVCWAGRNGGGLLPRSMWIKQALFISEEEEEEVPTGPAEA